MRVQAQSADGDAASASSVTFAELALSAPVLAALDDVGYESPSPIQAATIPHILAGTDVVGQAQTGTGKTAAFALPLLSKIDIDGRDPQALVLVPTRELAIQVAEAFQRYATHLRGFHVLPIYGGQSYTPQLQSLRRGVHVIVGTPGRVMDHLKRGTLKLSTLKYLVLDEADEMLRMGFIDDVEWILGQAPKSRQIALFSATMPKEIRRIAQNHLNKPAEVTIRSKTSTASGIRQRFCMVGGMHNKLDALTRILEAEAFDAMLVFARTKQATGELAERLEARGFAVEALNGDIPQPQRERTVARLKAGQIDIVVATDVAARGLDVERISHVVNFDVPYDPESYVHRIGRTGRAGRSGEAILFIAPRERNMLRVIERATRQPITEMNLPTVADVNEQRVSRFNQRITAARESGEAEKFRSLIERYEQEHNVPAVEIAAALASLAQGKTPLFIDNGRQPASSEASREPRDTGRPRFDEGKRERGREPRASESAARDTAAPDAPRAHKPRAHMVQGQKYGDRSREYQPAARADRRTEESRGPAQDERPRAPARHAFEPASGDPQKRHPGKREDEPMQTYRIEVGDLHGIKPSNIVGAIANEVGIDGKNIGKVVIKSDHSFVDLPSGMPKEVFRSLQKVRVGGQQMQISLALRTHAEKLKREYEPALKRAKRPQKR